MSKSAGSTKDHRQRQPNYNSESLCCTPMAKVGCSVRPAAECLTLRPFKPHAADVRRRPDAQTRKTPTVIPNLARIGDALPRPLAIATSGKVEVLRLLVPVPPTKQPEDWHSWGFSLGYSLLQGMRRHFALDLNELDFELEGPWDTPHAGTPFKVFKKCYKRFDDRELSRFGRAQGCCQVGCWTSLLSGVRRR